MFRVERRGKFQKGICSVKKEKKKKTGSWEAFASSSMLFLNCLAHSERFSLPLLFAFEQLKLRPEMQTMKAWYFHLLGCELAASTVTGSTGGVQQHSLGPCLFEEEAFWQLFPQPLLRLMFWFLLFLPTTDWCCRCLEQRHGSWHHGMWQTGGVRRHGQLSGFPLKFYIFVSRYFFSAAVILLRFQSLEAFVL